MTPEGLDAGGAALWRAVTDAHQLDAVQEVTLIEACRAKDRLDRLDAMSRSDSQTWATVGRADLRLDLDRNVTRTADVLKQLLASLRLPDEHGRRPQRRGTARGVYGIVRPRLRND